MAQVLDALRETTKGVRAFKFGWPWKNKEKDVYVERLAEEDAMPAPAYYVGAYGGELCTCEDRGNIANICAFHRNTMISIECPIRQSTVAIASETQNNQLQQDPSISSALFPSQASSQAGPSNIQTQSTIEPTPRLKQEKAKVERIPPPPYISGPRISYETADSKLPTTNNSRQITFPINLNAGTSSTASALETKFTFEAPLRTASQDADIAARLAALRSIAKSSLPMTSSVTSSAPASAALASSASTSSPLPPATKASPRAEAKPKYVPVPSLPRPLA
ncbi:hypothetical protein HDU97_001710 [Phlyctochytrium planicorne]|nr:hypothetical protein HDU97_001710 [Phlyctochytrium planicorne]